MKKVVNGKMYNTETAEYIGTYSNNLSESDFRHLCEDLYKKKTGEFFLEGEGGPLTRYKEPVGDMWRSGSAIIPLDEAEAKAWVEAHLDAEAYIELFGEPEE